MIKAFSEKLKLMKQSILTIRTERPVFMRWITGLTLAPVLILLVIAGRWYFTSFVALICMLAISEYFRITFIPEGKTISGFLFLFSVGISAGIISAVHFGRWQMAMALTGVNLILCGALSLFQFKNDRHILNNIARQVQGVTYISVSLAILVGMRNSENGIFWIFFLLIIIFSGDIGAFYVGRNFGKHKLCPSISPGKTWEGAAGGILSNILFGSCLKMIFLPSASWGISIIFFIIAGAVGQIGDLFESELKRAVQIKDSGFILPGHGGILDRIDALLFAAPVAFLFKEFLL